MKTCVTFALLLAGLLACSAPTAPPPALQTPTYTDAPPLASTATPQPEISLTPTDTEIPSATPSLPADTPPSPRTDAPFVGRERTFTGQVTDATSFSKGFKFRLDDGRTQIVLLTWTEIYDGIEGCEGLRPGARVQVTGEIGEYEGELQIIPFSAADVVVLEPGVDQALQRETGALMARDVGHWVRIEGQVTRVESFSQGGRVFVDDGSGEVLLLLWQNILERLSDGGGAATVGSRLRAIGQVQEYQGTLEVVPALPYDVVTLAQPVVSVTPASSAFVPVGDIHAGRIGEQLTTAGEVTDTASFSSGFKFTLDDGTGQIVLLTWHNVYDALREPHQLNVGAKLSVTGEVQIYEGELQIQPRSADQIAIIEPNTAVPSSREVGSITDFLGQRITITGYVDRVQDTGSGTRIYMIDDTGEALVFIWNNIMERIADNVTLRQPGARARVTGLVQEYRGELELVPSLPIDVEVLR
jgi:DNA/RNA endonuclease YhcR with UshA esterase domain